MFNNATRSAFRYNRRRLGQLSIVALLGMTTIGQAIGQANAQSDLSKIKPEADEDRDGVPNYQDNCLLVANPGQEDADNDGFGNLCDGDVNNDRKVNALDLGLVKNPRRPLKERDVNGDGRVDDQDLAMIKAQFLGAPGPSMFAPEESLRTNPPTPSQVKYLSLGKSTDKGNVVVTAKFEGRKGGVISIRQDDVVQFNDLGISPDGVAEDGVFSAFSTLQLQEINAKVNERASKRDAQPTFFAGRSILSEEAKRRRKELEERSRTAAAQALTTSQSTEPAVDPELNPTEITDSPALTPGPVPASSNPDHSIAINSPLVVAHPAYTFDPCNTDDTGNSNSDAPWSFKTLMANIAAGSGMSTQMFIHQWLNTWMHDQTINGFNIPARTGVPKFFPGWDPNNHETLNLEKLPFRLLAILNRLDLVEMSLHGFTENTAEIRFVFGLLEDVGQPNCGAASVMEAQTVIFEYGDSAGSCSEVKSRADEWIELSDHDLGSEVYMAKLKAITDRVTVQNANFGRANGSALNQLRVNDFAFDDESAPFDPNLDPDERRARRNWELREFKLYGVASPFYPDPLDQTPAERFRDVDQHVMTDFVEQNWLAVACRSHSIPFDFNGKGFAAGTIRYTAASAWLFPFSTDPALVPAFLPCGDTIAQADSSLTQQDLAFSELRHTISLNTCDDCHARETKTRFAHVDPTDREFSKFMTGGPSGIHTVNDPALGSLVKREFNDILRRRQIVEAYSLRDCGTGVLLDPENLVPPSSPH